MKNIKILWLVVFLLPCAILAQNDRSKYALLWEISGNNLTQKSYLFGSMHVNDRRVFEFSDSLLPILETCEAFALEIHLDTMMQKIMEDDTFFDQNQDRDKERTSWGLSQFGLQKGDKATFLDAYLFNLAKKMNKSIYGLEDAEDHINYYNDAMDAMDAEKDFKQGTKMYEEFIRVYTNGDLAYFEDLYQKEADSILILRNHKMLAGMEAIMPRQSLFSVVGLMHLVGEEGLLNLLQKKGYRVRKVQADFTGVAQNYKINDTGENIPWYETKDTQLGIRFYTPQRPLPMPLDISQPVKVYYYPDIAQGIHYILFLGDTPPNSSWDDTEATLKNITDSLGKFFHGEIISKQWIEEQEPKQYEIILKNTKEPLEWMRMRFIFHPQRFYMLLTMTLEDLLNHPDIQRFYNSIDMLDTDKSWKPFYNPKAAFSVLMQGEPSYQTRDVPVQNQDIKQKIHLYMTDSDDSPQKCLMRYNDFPTGQVIQDDSTVFESFKYSLTSRIGDLPYDWNPIELDGYPGYELECILEETIRLRSRFYLRGNREYMLIFQEDKGEKDTTFFDSFKFEPFQPMVLDTVSLEDVEAKILFPADFKKTDMEDEQEDFKAYEATESSTGSVFVIARSDFSNYEYYPTIDSLLNAFRDSYASGEGEEIVLEKKEPYRGLDAAYYVVKNKYTNIRKILKVVLDRDRMYILAAYVADELLKDPSVDHFFNSLEPAPRPEVKWSLFTPKLDLILTDISSTDSLTCLKARMALSNYSWKQEDIGKLYQALEKDYKEDSLRFYNIKKSLIDAFADIHDSLTVSVLKKLYLQNDYSDYQEQILGVISSIPEKESIEAFLELARTAPPDYFYPGWLASTLTSSWELLEPYLPEFISLAEENPTFHNLTFQIFDKLLEDSTIHSAYYQPYQPKILTMVQNDLRAITRVESSEDDSGFLGDLDKYYHAIYTWISICYSLPPDAEIIGTMEKVMESGIQQTWLKTDILQYCFSNKLEIQQAWIEELLTDSLTYLTTLRMLQDRGQLGRVSKKHLNEEKFAYCAMLEYLDDDESELYDFQLEKLLVQKVKFLEKTHKIYVFKIRANHDNYDYDESMPESDENQPTFTDTYLGIVGPILVKKNFIDFSNQITNFHYEPLDFDKIVLNAQILALVKETESYYMEEEEEYEYDFEDE